MTQLSAREAAIIDRMEDPIAKRFGLGTRIRNLEGGTIASGTSAQVPVCDSGGTPTPVTLSGAGTITTAGVLTITKVGATDTSANKIFGFTSTRNTADSSMYVAVTDSSGYERGQKVCYAPAANGGGYFESQFVNTKVAASMAGTIRASEHKVSVTGTANASGEVVGVYSKINVETGATAASAVGVDVEFDPEGSATITSGVGVRVKNSTKISHAIDVSGAGYSLGAIKLPYVDGNAAVSIAALEAAFGTDNAKEGVIGLYQDDSDATWLILGNSTKGKYQKVAATEVAS